MRILLRGAIVGVLALASASCSSESGGGGSANTGTGGTGPIAIDNLQAEFEDGYCKASVQCESGAFGFTTVAGCKLFIATFGAGEGDGADGLPNLVAGVKAGTIKYDAAKARECLKTQTQCSTLAGNGDGGESAACRATFTGTLALGATCKSKEYCGSGRCQKDATGCGKCAVPVASGGACSASADCATALVCSNAKCAAPGSSKIGDPCGGSNADCPADAYCAVSGTGSTCTARLDKGGACKQGTDCKTGFTCAKPAGGGGQGVCAEPAAEGKDCSFEAAEACAKGLTCVVTGDFSKPETIQSTCKPARKIGEVCENSLQCKGLDAVCGAGKCVAVAAKGGSCEVATPQFKSPCAPGLVCDAASKKCGDAPAIGQPCGENGLCAADARCDETEKKCVVRSDVGAKCDQKSDCKKGLACDQGPDHMSEGKCAAAAVCQ